MLARTTQLKILPRPLNLYTLQNCPIPEKIGPAMQASETFISVLVQGTVPEQLQKRVYSDLPSRDQSSDCRVGSEAFYFCGKMNIH